jgi:hypothetical protein
MDFLLGGAGLDTISDTDEATGTPTQDLYIAEIVTLDTDNPTPLQLQGMSANDQTLIAQLTLWQKAIDNPTHTARVAVAANVRGGATNDGMADKILGAALSWDYVIYSTGALLKNTGGDQLDVVA